MLAALLHGLTCRVVLPPWMGEDEPWYVEYAYHIAEGHLPWGGIRISGATPEKGDDRWMMSLSQLGIRERIGGVTPAEPSACERALLDSMRAHHVWARVDFAGWGPGAETLDQFARGYTATHQPPTCYLATGGLMRALGIRGVEPRLWAMRAFSLLCYLAVVACAHLVGRCVFDDGWLALAAGLFVAWLPMHARQAAVANNDVLAKVFSSLAILCGVRVLAGRGRDGTLALLLAFAALGLLTKASAAGALAVVVPALGWRVRGRFGTRRARLLAAGVAALIAAGGALYWYGGHNPAIPRSLVNIGYRLTRALDPDLYEGLWRTLVGSFGWETRWLPEPVYAVAALAAAAAGAGALWVLVRRRPDVDRRLLSICAAAVALQLALIALRGEGRGRYLFPVLPALGALVAAGCLGPLPAGRRAAAFAVLAAALVIFDVLFLWRGLVWSQYGAWGS